MAQMTQAHVNQAKQLGLNDQQIQQLQAAGFDWSKMGQLFQLIVTVLPQILSLFGQQPAPTPGPTPIAPAQQTP
jgi:hypothetical protein